MTFETDITLGLHTVRATVECDVFRTAGEAHSIADPPGLRVEDLRVHALHREVTDELDKRQIEAIEDQAAEIFRRNE